MGENMDALIFRVFLVCLSVLLLSVARFGWLVCIQLHYDRQARRRQDVINRLEREIVIERLRCAAANPEAAAILGAWEDARSGRVEPSDRDIYRRFFQRAMGGEPREVVLSEEEAEAERRDEWGLPPIQ